jgi:hypothetical protein
MNAMTRSGCVLLLLLLSGCASAGSPGRPNLPYPAWRLGFLAPLNMEVWTEAAEVEDVRGRRFPEYHSGTVSMGYAMDFKGGWGGGPLGWGKGRDVTGADLPKRIYVRWQSLVEPQTYATVLDIPEQARKLMLTKGPPATVPNASPYRKALAIGLAPGGYVKVWVTGPTAEAIEVLCQQAAVEPKGPYDGESGGKYRQLTERAMPYIKAHPVIPYDSWKCPPTMTTPAEVEAAMSSMHQPDVLSLPGRYYLNGVMEMGSTLILREDGTFEADMEYGAADGYASGRWTRKDSPEAETG